MVYARRANLEPYVWGICVFAFLAATLSSFLAVSAMAAAWALVTPALALPGGA